MGRVFVAILISMLAVPAQGAALSRYCSLHHMPTGGAVNIITSKLVVVERAHGITSADVFHAAILRDILADRDDPAPLSRIDDEELARLVADAHARDAAQRQHVTASEAETDAALAGLEHASGNPQGELKARLARDSGIYALLRRKIAAALLQAKLDGRPFAFPYRISPPPPCPLLP